MTLEYRKLDEAEITAGLAKLPHWSIVDGQISRTFKFENYLEGPKFAIKVGKIAEDINHHPDIHIGYCQVTVRVNTHDVGGLSPYDFELARLVDMIL